MTVFIIQDQQKMDHATGKYVSRFDFSSAEQYGEFEYLLPPNASPFKSEETMKILHEKLNNFSDDDHILLVGNPVLIGLATAIAADRSKSSVTFLQWSGAEKRYAPITVKIFY